MICASLIPRFFVTALLALLVDYYDDSLFSFRRIPLKRLLWCIPPLAVVFVNFPYSALISGAARITNAALLPLFLFKCFLIGLSEEWIFRGILFDFLYRRSRQKGGTCFTAVLVSSLIFGAFHLFNLLDGANAGGVLLQCGYSFLIGAMLAVVFLKTQNLWICVILHTLFDFGGFIVGDLGTGAPQDTTFWILTIVTGVLCAVHIIVTLVKIVRKEKNSPAGREVI